MMRTRYVLDTNILTAVLRHHPGTVEHITQAAIANAEILLCPIVYFEALRGLLHRDAKKQKQQLLEYAAALIWDDFDSADWERAAELWADLRGRGIQIDDADLLIGMFALQREAVVVTANEKHFLPLGVKTENWLE